MTYLIKEMIDDNESLERILKEMHEAYEKEKVPMTEDQTRWSMSIMLASDEEIDEQYNKFSNHWQFKGFFKRMRIFKIKYEKRLLVWLGVMSIDFGIGGMILIGYYVQWWASKKAKFTTKLDLETKNLSLSAVCEECFAFGVFQKSTIHEFWDKQKVKSTPDNLIDYPTAALSFTTCHPMDTITYKHESFN